VLNFGEELTGQKRTLKMLYLKGCYRPLQLSVHDLKQTVFLECPYSLAADSIDDHDHLVLCCLVMAENFTLADFAVGAED
jgi:hypothetical protein